MRVLVIGSGGREHALAWKLSRSPQVREIFCIPGNGGTGELAQNVGVNPEDFSALSSFALEKKIDLTVVGPEAPLVAGLADHFESQGLKVFGPGKLASQMEGSKIFAKNLMLKHGIPTAAAEIFDDCGQAAAYIRKLEPPVVVKADGLAAGKGVAVARSREEAITALEDCLVAEKFGAAGKRVVVEEFLSGPEVSVLAFVDGETLLPMEPAQDYKRVFDGDEGPNTGGMGAYSPVPGVTAELCEQIIAEILKPTLRALVSEDIKYRGVLYAGLVLTKEGPRVLEFNVRFGDPESQALLPRLQGDLAETMLAVAEGRLSEASLQWSQAKCVTVVLASRGYPGSYPTGLEISGLDEAKQREDACVFHAGTKKDKEKVLTAGGRVLNVTAWGQTFEEARARVYGAVKKIGFEGMHYRKDIALQAATGEAILAAPSGTPGGA
jgi:phosphoribosylamine--glycine ligase